MDYCGSYEIYDHIRKNLKSNVNTHFYFIGCIVSKVEVIRVYYEPGASLGKNKRKKGDLVLV